MANSKEQLGNMVADQASSSNTVLVILLIIIVLNFFILDPIPFVDEIISIPVAIAIINKLMGDRKKRHKSSPPKDHIDTSKAEEGEIVD